MLRSFVQVTPLGILHSRTPSFNSDTPVDPIRDEYLRTTLLQLQRSVLADVLEPGVGAALVGEVGELEVLLVEEAVAGLRDRHRDVGQHVPVGAQYNYSQAEQITAVLIN
jgi:hypothetical protein